MGEVAQFILDGPNQFSELELGPFTFAAKRMSIKSVQVIKTEIVSINENQVYINKIEIDDGDYLVEYPVRANFSKTSRSNSENLCSLDTGITSSAIFKHLTTYHRVSNKIIGRIKVGVHYKSK